MNLMDFVYLTWLELFVFVFILPTFCFLLFGYLVRLRLVLRILNKQFFQHWIILPNSYISSKVILSKEIEVDGKSSFIKGMKAKGSAPRFLIRPEKEYKFYYGGVLTVAHRYNDPNPLQFQELKEYIFQKDNNAMSAMDLGVAIDSDLMKDYNRSIYGKKDIMVLLFLMGLLAISALNIYLTYESSQSMNTIINFFNHYFSSTSSTTT